MTSQEILAPAMFMRERHDALDEEFGQINDQLGKLEAIIQSENDPVLMEKYSNFHNNLLNARDTLMDRGITSNSRRQMLDLRGQFQSQMAPIEVAFEERRL